MGGPLAVRPTAVVINVKSEASSTKMKMRSPSKPISCFVSCTGRAALVTASIKRAFLHITARQKALADVNANDGRVVGYRLQSVGRNEHPKRFDSDVSNVDRASFTR